MSFEEATSPYPDGDLSGQRVAQDAAPKVGLDVNQEPARVGLGREVDVRQVELAVTGSEPVLLAQLAGAVRGADRVRPSGPAYRAC